MIPILLIFLLRFCSGQAPPGMTYIVNMDSQIECCDEESKLYLDISEVFVGRYNETTAYMYGLTKIMQPIGANTMMQLILQREVSGTYETVLTHEICDICDEVTKGKESHYHDYMRYLTIPEQCPFEVGNYPVNNFIVDTEDLPLNSNTAGRYQAFMNFYNNPEQDCMTTKELLFCVTVKFLIEMA